MVTKQEKAASDIPSLLKVVGKATGPDAGIDYVIGGWLWAQGFEPWQCYSYVDENKPSRPFTSSIDTAVELVEMMGFRVHMLHMGTDGSKGAGAADICRPNKVDENYNGEGKTPALAILVALFTALYVSHQNEAQTEHSHV